MQQLDAPAAAAFIAAESAAGRPPLLLDVREPWECAVASIRIDGVPTLDVPMQQVPARLAEIDPLQSILCICHHGMRSAQVVAFLERQGHSSVYNLAGGIDAWSAKVDPAVPRY